MRLPRRKFLKASVISAISAGLALTSARVGIAQKRTRGGVKNPITRRSDLSPEVQSDPVFSFTEETYKPYIGGIFTALNGRGETIELELLRVEPFKSPDPLRYTRSIGKTESFSLTFRAAAELSPFTWIHRFDHAALGVFYLFLTKRVSETGELLYDAVINHLR